MGKKRKNRYLWTCTGCGHKIERRPEGEKYEALCAAHDQLIEAAAEHLKGCSRAWFGKSCVAYRQPRIAEEMKILEAQYRAAVRPHC